MILFAIACLALGVFEIYVFQKGHYIEDLLIMCGAFGVAMFLTALILHGGVG